MSDKKLTEQEIENKLGIKLEYYNSSHYSEDLDQTFTNSYLEEKSEQDLIDVELKALSSGDVEKAELSHSLLKNGTKFGLIHYTDEQKKELGQLQNETMKKVIQDIESLDENASVTQIEEMVKQGKMLTATVEKVDFKDDEYTQLQEILTQKTEELQVDFLNKYTQELDNIDLENFNKEDITEIFEKYDEICDLCDGKTAEEGKKQLRETIQKKVEEKIKQLDERLQELKEHIEIPENEQNIDELQNKIEDLEEILVDFKAKQDFKENWKAQKGWDGLEYHSDKYHQVIKGTEKERYEELYKKDYRKIHNHKEMRLQEQGKDTSEIMQDIASYRDYGRGTDDYRFVERNSEVTKRTKYLEGKLAILREHQEIEGNSQRIEKIEQELETMQDAWVVAQRGFNHIDNDIQQMNEEIKSISERVTHYEEELKGIAVGTKSYEQKMKQIERAKGDIKIYENRIDRLNQTKEEIESGENPTFMGEHHRDRYNQEQEIKRQLQEEIKAKAEQERIAKIEQEERLKAEQEMKVKAEQEAEVKKEQERMAKAQAEYGLSGITDRETLQKRLEDMVSKGIHYSASDNPSQMKKFETLKQVVPEYDEFKRTYLDLRVAGLEDKLYEGLDFKNLSYDELLERATAISREEQERQQQEKTRVEQGSNVKIENNIESNEINEKSIEQEHIQSIPKTKVEKKEQEQISQVNIEKSFNNGKTEIEENIASQPVSKTVKTYEQQQPEKIRPREESIKDDIENQFENNNMQFQKRDSSAMDLWMNRFSNWYSSIDKLAQNVKAKFVKMKSDIMRAISDRIKERNQKQEMNKDQDENER